MAVTIALVSNYFTHHQQPLCQALYELTEHEFYFIETEEMEQERKAMGWTLDAKPPYVLRYADNSHRCREAISQADAVIWGSCPYRLILSRIFEGKLTFHYTERIFKRSKTGFSFWGRVVKYGLLRRAPQKSHYLLAASAYTAADYALLGQYRERALRWGYFPQTREYDLPRLMEQKVPGFIVWAARLIGWKHPEYAVRVALRLRQKGIPFTMELVGGGELEQTIQALLAENHLQDCVRLTGVCTPQQVREKMERAAVFLMTSDQNEGWGAVLNEAMNSGCAAVACVSAGAAPFLIADGVNGLIYQNGDVDALAEKVCFLLRNPAEAARMGQAAYHTITSEWNGQCAAKRLVELTRTLTAGQNPKLPESGPCSAAPILTDKGEPR